MAPPRLPFRVFKFNLNGGMEDVVPPAHVGGLSESPADVVGNDVSTETRLTTG